MTHVSLQEIYIIPLLRNNEKSDQSHVRAIKVRVVNYQHYFYCYFHYHLTLGRKIYKA